ncbi:hypothetical protein K402DRAFT_325401 [Aulographum hederae CBS 113979]|uniref:Uncharacterized protein n=1 Tax=Aulographum hederae CBS 113979 TaxID=1176131 RepID=A0A6G1HAN8_9PEZI|nr:hypothetical protein K402DRAFT_325401 [Aulographum hederae CBS 113979]
MKTFQLVVRDDSADIGMPKTMLNLLIALLVLVFVGTLLIAGLIILRNIRRARKDSQLPTYEPGHRSSKHRGLTISTTPYSRRSESSIYVIQEKQNLIANSSSPPPSPIPEIHITFPDEVDEAGKRQSGRVVVVRVGEHSVGLEPLQGDLPPYQQSDSERFQSLDLERIGGLKEKNHKMYA